MMNDDMVFDERVEYAIRCPDGDIWHSTYDQHIGRLYLDARNRACPCRRDDHALVFRLTAWTELTT